MRKVTAGGGWAAIRYTLRKGRQAGFLKLWRAMRARNACKTCALGMGGQHGGMVNEAGHFPEVCKKSIQAMVADMQGRILARLWRELSIAQLRGLTSRELEHLGRLAEPIIAGPVDSHFRPISWDEALSFCVDRLRNTPPDQNFFYASGRSSNEAGFLLQLFARVYGTNNVNNCSYYCHQASGVGLADTLGTATATVELDDLEHCDLLLLIGANPASNHPRLMTQLMKLRRRGGQVIVINPVRETGLTNFRVPSDVRSLLKGSAIASLYVQPHAGGDLALLIGLAKALLERAATSGRCDTLDEDFIRAHTDGFDGFLRHVQAIPWDAIISAAGVERALIERIVDLYAAARATIFSWTMGITHHLHGVDNVRAIVNLALLRGMVGRKHAGLMPIRGHSNVQGMGSVGVTPKLRPAFLDRLQAHFGVRIPESPGLDTLSCLQAMGQGRLRNAWCLGGNLFGASPDSTAAAAAFAKLESVAYLSTTLNTGHVWGRGDWTLILPVRARDEERQPTTQESMFNYVRLSDGGQERLEGPRGEVEILAQIAHSVLGDNGPVDWCNLAHHAAVRRAIAAIVPGYEPAAAIDQTRREFHVAGRVLHEPAFATPSGTAHFRITPLPPQPSENGRLRLITLRSEGQFNTVVYEEEDLYRGQDRRDVILMNASDIAARNLHEDQVVSVQSAAGRMSARVRSFDIRAGNAAMYYPEANMLVPAVADPESRTPAFKNVSIRVDALAGPPPVSLTVGPRNRDAGPRQPMRAC